MKLTRAEAEKGCCCMKKIISCLMNVLSFITFIPLIVAAIIGLIYTALTWVMFVFIGFIGVRLDANIAHEVSTWPFEKAIMPAARWLQGCWMHIGQRFEEGASAP